MKMNAKPHKKFEYLLFKFPHNIESDIGMRIIHKGLEIDKPPKTPPEMGKKYFLNLLVKKTNCNLFYEFCKNQSNCTFFCNNERRYFYLK